MKEYEVVVTTYDESGNWCDEYDPITITASNEKEAIAKAVGNLFAELSADESYAKVVAEGEYVFFALNNDCLGTDYEDRYYDRVWIKEGE